jgi:hypothetical protein
MKRRGFFGVMAGAAVAGPGMAKEAINQISLDSLNLSGGGVLGQTLGTGGYAKQAGVFGAVDEVSQAQGMVKRLVGMTAAQRAAHKRRFHVGQLDPDIASYRSIALHAKIDWQRERNLDAAINERKTMWQRLAEGLGYDTADDYML